MIQRNPNNRAVDPGVGRSAPTFDASENVGYVFGRKSSLPADFSNLDSFCDQSQCISRTSPKAAPQVVNYVGVAFCSLIKALLQPISFLAYISQSNSADMAARSVPLVQKVRTTKLCFGVQMILRKRPSIVPPAPLGGRLDNCGAMGIARCQCPLRLTLAAAAQRTGLPFRTEHCLGCRYGGSRGCVDSKL